VGLVARIGNKAPIAPVDARVAVINVVVPPALPILPVPGIEEGGECAIADDGPDPIDTYVGDRVKTRRRELRLSQTELSNVLGVSYQQVQIYENGSNRIGGANLLKIAKALGVEVSYFFEGVEDTINEDVSPKAEIPEQDPLSAKESTGLAQDFNRIKDAGVRKRISQLFRELAKTES
jgi:transcriptional regulator with XRE-family HTH domain